ncbi:MAG TPA: hypothetical protein VJK53_06160 [Candidatus Paceibacterota bacterium]
MNSKILGLVGVVLIIGTIAFVLLSNKQVDVAAISNFQECADAGYPIMPARTTNEVQSGGESYPEQCATPDGRTFINETSRIPPPETVSGETSNPGTGPIVANGCAVAGCSMQLCVSVGEAANVVSTCEYKAEYACYKQALCEPQQNGKCGWTETAELKACLQNPPLDSSQSQVY